MSKKLTPWFPMSVKPVRRGYYIATVDRTTFYRYWDGMTWHAGDETLSGAQYCYETYPSRSETPLEWRGLAKKP